MRILRLPEVSKTTGVPVSSIYKLMKNKSFPPCVHISSRSVGWVDLEILEWMESRVKSRDNK